MYTPIALKGVCGNSVSSIIISLVVSTHLKNIRLSNWIISPGRGENKKCLKPQASHLCVSCFVSYNCDATSVLPHVSLWSFSFLPGDPGGLKENDTPSTGAVPARNKDIYIYTYIYMELKHKKKHGANQAQRSWQSHKNILKNSSN